MSVDPKTQLGFAAVGANAADEGEATVRRPSPAAEPDPPSNAFSVIDLAASPASPSAVTTVTLSHDDPVQGIAVDRTDEIAVVVSGSLAAGSSDGFVDVFDESTLLASFRADRVSAPALGSGPSGPSGPSGTLAIPEPNGVPEFPRTVQYDIATDQVVINVANNSNCPEGANCNGYFDFDPVTETFGSFVAGRGPVNFALDQTLHFLLEPSRLDSTVDSEGQINIIDTATTPPEECVLTDANLSGADIGSASDPTTGIELVSNEAGQLIALNLFGATVSGSPAEEGCTVNEGGTTPNSTIPVFASPDQDMTVQVLAHQLFFTDSDFFIHLTQLPLATAAQIDPTAFTNLADSALPTDPNGCQVVFSFNTNETAIDPVGNFAYLLDLSAMTGDPTFLVQINLADFIDNQDALGTPLPTGTCPPGNAFACSNGEGVTFFPLPGASEAGASCPG
ncbi:MAG TPA: hypothetical protein VEJ86_02325 [Candidatus Binataceae bacterium]|nr:hypothetical protein [Candidatus Binataceae bacterium]